MSPRSEFLAGMRDISPVLLGTIPFGLVAGVAVAAAGMSAVEGIALSLFAFSGIAQLVTSQLIATDSPAWVTVSAAFVVSLRLLMYSAALSPHLMHLDRRWRALLAFLMTDQSFALTMRIASDPARPHFHWHFLGSGLTLYAAWQAAVVLGVGVGAQVPATWSLDFAVTLTFISLLVPAVRTRADLAAGIVAGAVALLASGLPYRLALVVATIAGIAAGMALEIRTARR